MQVSKRPFITERERTIMIAGFLLGKPDDEIARETGTSVRAVSIYRKNCPPELLVLFRKEDLYLMEKLILDNLKAGLTATRKIAEITSNEDWIRQQGADELSEFYEAISSANLRVLEALERAQQREDRDPRALRA